MSLEHQRQTWTLLKTNIKAEMVELTPETLNQSISLLLQLNLVRGQGLLVRTIMKWVLIDDRYSAMFSDLIAELNEKIPSIGKLCVNRVLIQFKKNYVRNNKRICISSIVFLSHLVVQRVVSDIVLLQILQLLLEDPNEDTIDMSIEMLKVCGKYLETQSPAAAIMIFDRFRDLLQEGNNSSKSIEYLLRFRRAGFKRCPSPRKESENVHIIELGEELVSHDELNVFRYDEKYEASEREYKQMKESWQLETPEKPQETKQEEKQEVVVDMSQADQINFQKTVYITVMSSMSANEAVHKLLRLAAKSANDEVLIDTVIKCCSQEKTYSKFYGIIGEKMLDKPKYQAIFTTLFQDYYNNISNYEVNAIRNIGKFFGYLFSTDLLELNKVFNHISLNERDTNSQGRILLKFIFQGMIEELGMTELKKRLSEDYIKRDINGMFPVVDITWDDAEDLRFSINFFTAIGLGELTDEMRSVLSQLRPPEERGRSRSRSTSRSSSYSSSYSRSYSRSVSYSRSRSRSQSRSPRRSSRNHSPTRSFSRTPSREPLKRRQPSLSPPPKRRR